MGDLINFNDAYSKKIHREHFYYILEINKEFIEGAIYREGTETHEELIEQFNIGIDYVSGELARVYVFSPTKDNIELTVEDMTYEDYLKLIKEVYKDYLMRLVGLKEE